MIWRRVGGGREGRARRARGVEGAQQSEQPAPDSARGRGGPARPSAPAAPAARPPARARHRGFAHPLRRRSVHRGGRRRGGPGVNGPHGLLVHEGRRENGGHDDVLRVQRLQRNGRGDGDRLRHEPHALPEDLEAPQRQRRRGRRCVAVEGGRGRRLGAGRAPPPWAGGVGGRLERWVSGWEPGRPVRQQQPGKDPSAAACSIPCGSCEAAWPRTHERARSTQQARRAQRVPPLAQRRAAPARATTRACRKMRLASMMPAALRRKGGAGAGAAAGGRRAGASASATRRPHERAGAERHLKHDDMHHSRPAPSSGRENARVGSPLGNVHLRPHYSLRKMLFYSIKSPTSPRRPPGTHLRTPECDERSPFAARALIAAVCLCRAISYHCAASAVCVAPVGEGF
jgi:hypothetical protein